MLNPEELIFLGNSHVPYCSHAQETRDKSENHKLKHMNYNTEFFHRVSYCGADARFIWIE